MVEIRRMTSGDVPAVHALGANTEEFRVVKDSTNIFWQKETLEDIAEKEIAYVVKEQSQIVGFLIATYQASTRKLTWENMYLKPEYRQRNIVAKCWALAEQEARKRGATYICAMVEQDNIPCIRSLEKIGFVQGKNYVWMEKSI